LRESLVIYGMALFLAVPEGEPGRFAVVAAEPTVRLPAI
jgi:hypothetical protein